MSTLAVQQIFETAYSVPRGEGAAPAVRSTGPLGGGSGAPGLRPPCAPASSSPTARRCSPSTSPPHSTAPKASSPTRARAAGDRVVFEGLKPHPRFALLLSNHFCSVVLEEDGERLGTGAYVVAPDATAEEMRLVRNPHYRGVPAIDEVVFAYYPPGAGDSHEALIAALESGHVHYSDALSRDDVGKLQAVRKHFQPGISTCALYFNTERPFLRDARVRRALALAIDRGELSRLSYENALAFTATSLLPPLMASFRDGIRTNPARRRSARPGGGGGPARLRLLMVWGPRAYLPHPTQVADAIASSSPRSASRSRLPPRAQRRVLSRQRGRARPGARRLDRRQRRPRRVPGGEPAVGPGAADGHRAREREQVALPQSRGRRGLAALPGGSDAREPCRDHAAAGRRRAAAAPHVRADGGGPHLEAQERRGVTARCALLRALRHRRLSAALASLRLRYPPRGGLSAKGLNSFRNWNSRNCRAR